MSETDTLPPPDPSSGAPPDQTQNGVLTAVRHWSATLLPVLGMVAAAVYTLLLLWYRSLYGYFGLTPRDVGLNQETVVTQAAGAALTIAGMLFIFFAPRQVASPPDREPPVWKLPVVTGTFLITLVAFVMTLVMSGLRPLVFIVLIAAAFWFWPFIWSKLRGRHRRDLPPTTASRLVIGYGVALALVLSIIALQLDGVRTGERLANKQPTGFVSGLLELRVPHVEVTEADGKTPSWAVGADFVLLGSADGRLRLFDRSNKRTVSVDAGDTVVLTPNGLP